MKLPHEFDLDKRGIWFAQKLDDLKTDKSLFLKTAGCIDDDGAGLYGVGIYGYYWSNTGSENNRWHGYYLYFGNYVNGVAKDSCSYGFSVLCVSDINKSEVMETNQEIEFKIPEGYVIDDSKSTKDKIVCKKIEPEYPKSWNEAFISEAIKGYYVEGSSIEYTGHNKCTIEDRNTFKTKKQAASTLAYAQLTQLMALPCYNGGWVPNWDDLSQQKYFIIRLKSDLVKINFSSYFCFLAFKSEKVRDEFYHNHMDLIKQFYEL